LVSEEGVSELERFVACHGVIQVVEARNSAKVLGMEAGEDVNVGTPPTLIGYPHRL